MKMQDIFNAKGTYAAVRYNQYSVNLLDKWCNENAIPKTRTSIDRLHTTILYSRKHLPNCKNQPVLESTTLATARYLDVWDTRDGARGIEGTTRALILVLDSPHLDALHEKLMAEHDAHYDFEKFIPHITLSYNIGNMTLNQMSAIPNFTLTATSLYVEDIRL